MYVYVKLNYINEKINKYYLVLNFFYCTMEYTIQEKVHLVSYSIAHENTEEARRLFTEKFNKAAPVRSLIKYWQLKLLETGSLVKDRPRSGRPLEAATQENKENVVAAISNNPSTSTRIVAAEVGISKSSVGRILKAEHYHPYKPLYCQMLYDGDADRRLEFAQNILARFNHDPAFLRKIHFSDECVFHLNSTVNKHNVHYWGLENPHVRVQNPGKTQAITVWACIGFSGVISCDISRQTMNGERYLQILTDKVQPHFSRGTGATWLFQQDGATPHYTLAARQFLDKQLNGRWIGRRGPIEWPARSPDLTTCDFWLWAYLRQKIYPTAGFLYPNLNQLEQSIAEEMERIPLHYFRKSMRDFEERINKVIAVNGEHFEQ